MTGKKYTKEKHTIIKRAQIFGCETIEQNQIKPMTRCSNKIVEKIEIVAFFPNNTILSFTKPNARFRFYFKRQNND